MDEAFDQKLRNEARAAWTLGLAAVLLAMVAPCGSCVTLVASLPLGLMATTKARTVLAATNLDAASEAYARTAQITGIASAVWASMILLLVMAYISLYFGVIAIAVAQGL
ncbi:MAG: hypothetical protein ABMB14_00850 [Myxococcota bacterium]